MRADQKFRFANAVLEILERDEDWSSDTIDDIALAAFELGLAKQNDETGLFETTE